MKIIIGLLLAILVISGFIMSNNFGMKVSQDGKDTQGGADSNMVMNSNFNSFKIVSVKTVTTSALTIPIGGTSAGTWTSDTITDTFPHNLGFTPVAIAYESLSNGQYNPLPYSNIPNFGSSADFAWFFQSTFSVDANYIYITHTISVYGHTSAFFLAKSVKVYLLQETAADN